MLSAAALLGAQVDVLHRRSKGLRPGPLRRPVAGTWRVRIAHLFVHTVPLVLFSLACIIAVVCGPGHASDFFTGRWPSLTGATATRSWVALGLSGALLAIGAYFALRYWPWMPPTHWLLLAFAQRRTQGLRSRRGPRRIVSPAGTAPHQARRGPGRQGVFLPRDPRVPSQTRIRYWVLRLYPYRRLHKSPGHGRRTGQTLPNMALQAFNGRRLFGQSLSRLLTATHPFTQDH